MFFYFGQMVGVQYILCGEEIYFKHLAYVFYFFYVLHSRDLYPVYFILVHQALQMFEFYILVKCDGIFLIGTKIYLGGKLVVTRVPQLFCK